jgi:hypothetical protein
VPGNSPDRAVIVGAVTAPKQETLLAARNAKTRFILHSPSRSDEAANELELFRQQV